MAKKKGLRLKNASRPKGWEAFILGAITQLIRFMTWRTGDGIIRWFFRAFYGVERRHFRRWAAPWRQAIRILAAGGSFLLWAFLLGVIFAYGPQVWAALGGAALFFLLALVIIPQIRLGIRRN